MAEVFQQFPDFLGGSNGATYRARACGGEVPGGTWEGWLEFVPLLDGAPVLRSGRETTQPNRKDTAYWATGLTPVYLQGALERALKPLTKRAAAAREEPAFDAPAPAIRTERGPEAQAVLDPFSVYQKGEALLRGQLAALSQWHLVNIIEKYELSTESPAVLNRQPAAALIDTIVSAVALS